MQVEIGRGGSSVTNAQWTVGYCSVNSRELILLIDNQKQNMELLSIQVKQINTFVLGITYKYFHYFLKFICFNDLEQMLQNINLRKESMKALALKATVTFFFFQFTPSSVF